MRALLTLKTICHNGQFHRSSVYRMIKEGLFPRPLKFGASSRWDAVEVDAAIQALADARKPNLKPSTEKHDDENQPCQPRL